MLLINKIPHQEILNYKKNIIDCLIYNSANNYIREVIVYLEASCKDLPNLKNVKYIIKRDKSIDELIEYSNKISKYDIIVANWDVKISDYELKNGNKLKSSKFKFFSKNNVSKVLQSDVKSKVLQNKTINNITIQNENINNFQINKNLNLDVIIVSVNYNDFLLLTLQNNVKKFENIHVVTSNDDFLCHKICEKFKVNCIKTDIMYEGGSKFNKGKAINFALNSLKESGFVLILDADIIVENEINLNELKENTIYSTGRYYINDYEQLKNYETTLSLQNFLYEDFKGIGFFQLFYNDGQRYPETFDDAGWSDLVFRDGFQNKEELNNTILHLGQCSKNWKGRITRRFLDDEVFINLLNKKSTFTICSYYFNFRNDDRQKNNFIKFLEQWKGYYDKMIVGIVDYGDIDFEIPCENLIIKGDLENKIWSKEILINKIVEKVETDYILWIDGDLIYDNLDWLENIDSLVDDNDFVQLFETINYLGENGEILETNKSIISANPKSDEIDKLLGEGFRPGGSWLGKTSILKKYLLFDKMYVGGGDTIFIYGLFGIKNGYTLEQVGKNNENIKELSIEWISNIEKYKIGYLKENINHLYHGKLSQRKYNLRYKKLKKFDNCSVIIPAYKAVNFLDECIKSILSQETNGDVEIIIGIDNCEETLSYVNNNKTLKDCKILYFEENVGPYIIRNTLTSISKYENILFFDADDLMCDGLIKKTVNCLFSFDSVRWMFNNFYDNFENIKRSPYHAHGVFAIKKEKFNQMNGFLPWRIGADSEFLERSKIKKLKIKFIDDICFYRRQHEENQTRNKITGLGTPKRIEVQKKLSQMKKNNIFNNPDYLHTEKFKLI